MRSWIPGLLSLVVVLTTSVLSAQQPALVLEGGTLIDGTGRPAVADAVVVVDGARIKAVGTRGRLQYPAGANVIRVEGRTILPGLIDGHVHLRDYQVPMFLPYGITTIADIHNDTAWSIAQREALKSGRIKGPRLFVSGARVTGRSAGADEGRQLRADAEEARAYVRTLKAAGVDHVKVDLTITDDQLRAVIEEAKAAGPARARAHAEHQEGRRHGHEAHGAHGHDGACAPRTGRARTRGRRGRRRRRRSIRSCFRRSSSTWSSRAST